MRYSAQRVKKILNVLTRLGLLNTKDSQYGVIAN